MRHDGAHVLDLNVDYAGRDNARDMSEIVKRVVRCRGRPAHVLDSTQSPRPRARVCVPGRRIINSANLQMQSKFDEVFTLAKTFGAAVVVGSIDEDKEASMARTAERKLAIALAAYSAANEVHEDILGRSVFDPRFRFPRAWRPIAARAWRPSRASGGPRAMPECQTTVGLSNVSFGLKPAARIVLNSAFLHELREAGLTSAIVHMSKTCRGTSDSVEQWKCC